MNEEAFHHRVSDGPFEDDTDEAILKLIRDAKNDESKAHLIVLFQINRNLAKNTVLVVGINDRLELTEKELISHRALVNKGAGFWRGLAITLGLVLLIGGYTVKSVFEDVKDLIKTQGEQNLEISQLRTNTPISKEASMRLTILENTMKQTLGELIELRHAFGDHERADLRQLSRAKK